MRHHYPIFCVCEGTGEDSPCTHGPDGSGMVGMGVMRVSDGGPEVGQANKMTVPEGWHAFKVKAPRDRVFRRNVSPMASPWAIAAGYGHDQMALACPKCSEHMKLEDIVKEAKDAADRGQVQ